MKKIYDKLVRDKIPEIITKSGRKANYRILNDAEYKRYLFKKLLEEVIEVVYAQTDDEQLDELADVEEVLEAIYKTNNGYSSLATRKNRKKLERGGFDKRYYLESVEEIL